MQMEGIFQRRLASRGHEQAHRLFGPLHIGVRVPCARVVVAFIAECVSSRPRLLDLALQIIKVLAHHNPLKAAAKNGLSLNAAAAGRARKRVACAPHIDDRCRRWVSPCSTPRWLAGLAASIGIGDLLLEDARLRYTRLYQDIE